MEFFWKGEISKAALMLENHGTRELFFYGITIGQIGFGIVVSLKRQPTKRALDGAPLCTCVGNWYQKNNPTKCGNCGKTRRQ